MKPLIDLIRGRGYVRMGNEYEPVSLGFTTEENNRLYALAAKHGIDPSDYPNLSECIKAIKALDK